MDSLGVLDGTGAAPPDEYQDASPEASDIEVWRKRLAGKDQKLTAALRELAALQEQAAQFEQALETERQKASGWYAEAMRAKYPRASSALPEGVNLDAAALSALEDKFRELEQQRIAAAPVDDFDEPRIDANSPRRALGPSQPKRPDEMTEDELVKNLRRYETWG
jgi:DNA repair exonuclease SbcCD ATPase subunit